MLSDEDTTRLRSLRARFPHWQITPGESGTVVALSHPTQTAEHILVAESVAELEAKLEQAES